MLLSRGDDPRRDRGVHRVEVVTVVVEQVERLEGDAFARELVDGRVPRRARVPHRDPLERGAGRGQQEIDPGRTEPDHDDARPAHPPAGTVVVVVVGVHAADFSLQTRGFGTVGAVTAKPVFPFASLISPQVP